MNKKEKEELLKICKRFEETPSYEDIEKLKGKGYIQMPTEDYHIKTQNDNLNEIWFQVTDLVLFNKETNEKEDIVSFTEVYDVDPSLPENKEKLPIDCYSECTLGFLTCEDYLDTEEI